MKKYFKHKIENLLSINKIVTLHFFEFDKNFKFRPESHDFWEIVFCDKEEIICNVNGKKISLNQGEMIFHKPGVLHGLSSNGVHAPDVFILSFVCHSEAMRFFEDRIIKPTKSQIYLLYNIFKEARRTFDIPVSDPETKKMSLLLKPTLGGQQIIKNNLEIMLIDIMRSLTETEDGNNIFLSENELDNKLVGDVIKIMQENIYNKINVDTISKKASYSKAYIFRIFKSTTGKSVMEYYTDLKIKTAKKLLRENELSVKEIAEKLCFDTSNYFSKTFKKFTGSTPTAYKKKLKKIG